MLTPNDIKIQLVTLKDNTTRYEIYVRRFVWSWSQFKKVPTDKFDKHRLNGLDGYSTDQDSWFTESMAKSHVRNYLLREYYDQIVSREDVKL